MYLLCQTSLFMSLVLALKEKNYRKEIMGQPIGKHLEKSTGELFYKTWFYTVNSVETSEDLCAF